MREVSTGDFQRSPGRLIHHYPRASLSLPPQQVSQLTRVENRIMNKHLVQRFFDKVQTNGTCWEWLGWRSQDGYGHFQVAGRDHSATHFVWFLVWHRWPEMLLHSCDHPWCVNPAHLSEAAQSDELDWHYTRKDQCIHGHPFDESNTYRYMDRRMCKACNRIRQLQKRVECAKPVQPVYLGAEESSKGSARLAS